MKAVLCGANGAMGKLIDGILGEEIVGRVTEKIMSLRRFRSWVQSPVT